MLYKKLWEKLPKIYLGLILLLLTIFCIPVTHIQVITPIHSCWLAQKQFTLQWRHSVEHQLWQEHYQQEGKNLLLNKTYLQTFGAGTPSQGKFISSPNGYIGYQTYIQLKQLNWVVSRNMQGILITDKGILPLYQQVPDYSQIQIVARTTILAQYLTQKCF